MSTDTQLKGDSLRRQLESSKQYALENNLELVESIDGIDLVDIGVSAFKSKNIHKGSLANFLSALDEGRIEKGSVLLLESLDRLSRDKLLGALTQFMMILEKGIEIITLTDRQSYTADKVNENVGSLYISLGVMFRANEESETKSKRLSSAWKNKRNNASNTVLTRTLPAWILYNETSKKLELDTNKSKVVREIFHMCIETCGLYGIAKHLNSTKVPVFGSGKLWYRSYISKIINNRAVFGEFQPRTIIDGKRVPDGDPISGYFPKVIDEQTFHLAHAQISRRTKADKGRKGVNQSIDSTFI